jgi:outer membrane protein TolC
LKIRKIRTSPSKLNPKTMNKNLLFCCLLLLVGSSLLNAQNPTRRVGSTYRNTTDTSALMDVREKLVQLALQNPNFEVADRRVSIADFQLRKAKGEWLSVVAPNLNLNELTLGPKSGGSQFLPLWNIGVSIPLSFYTQRKNEVKIAKENLYIAEAEKNERYREIRTKVLSKYEDYLMLKETVDLQNRVTQDAYLNFRQKEQDFKDDLLTVDDYNKAFQLYAEQQKRRLSDQRNLNVAKLEMEQMIGMPLDELLQKK